MPVRKRHDRRRIRLKPEQRAEAERCLQLMDDHRSAIDGKDQAFYKDGRHEELAGIAFRVLGMLGIRPWEDYRERLREALQELSK